jgi:dTDP-4-amino-4,6-dideoxygalactose transaminase
LSSASRTVPAFRPLLPSAERLLPYLLRIDHQRIYSNHGPLAEELESRLARAFGLDAGFVLTASSGTAALVGGILATAGRADAARPYALCPAYTFIGTVSALEQCGYRPHLVDIAAASWQMEPASLAEHPLLDRTGVIVPVAPLGRGVELRPWQELQQRTGIPVVVDAAASFEALLRAPQRHIGALPVALSFHATKVFATAEGGALVGTDPAVMGRAFRAMNFGFFGSRESHGPSINGKMSEYHAALGLANLDDWHPSIGRLHEVAASYRDCFARLGLAQRLYCAPDVAANYVVYEATDDPERVSVAAALLAAGIESRLWYGHGLQCQPTLQNVGRDPLPTVEDLAPRLLGLPVAPDLAPSTIARIAEIVCDSARGEPIPTGRRA